MKTVAVYGVGKAGLPLACVIAQAGFNVIGVGKNPNKAKLINHGFNPIPEEPGLSTLLKKFINKNLVITTNGQSASKKSQFHIIIVPLFIDKNKKPNFENIDNACKNIGLGLKKDDCVILETTVPVGTTRQRIKNYLEKYSKLRAGTDFFLAMSPERMMTGYAISRYTEFPKIVGGINKASTDKITDFYKKFCKKIIKVSSLEAAEITKISEGVYRDVNISLANELARICQLNKVEYNEVKKAAQNKFCHLHDPGNVGGHCIPVYPWFLINNYNVPLIKSARLLNDKMIEFYVDKVKTITKKGKVLVIGISFRENVKETAYTRSFPFIQSLKKRGYNVSVYDPLYSKEEIEKQGFIYSQDFHNHDCIVIMNFYPNLKKTLHNIKHVVVDIKNSLQ